MKKNVKQKAGFRWKCVLISMFILLLTRINHEQSSIVSKIPIYVAVRMRETSRCTDFRLIENSYF